MLKLFIPLVFFSSIIHAQTYFSNLAKDSDAVYLNSTQIALNKILKVEFLEHIDSTCFINYPLPPPPVNFIHHKIVFESNGLAKLYEWSFSDTNSIIVNEPDVKTSLYFITNEYKFQYNENNVTKINVSDASPVSEVNYSYNTDSIFQKIMFYQPDHSVNHKLFSFKKTEQPEIFRKNTGIKNVYYPKFQIINLGIVHSAQLYINDIPVSSYIEGKFEQKRFLMELHPGLFVFFEVNE